VKGVTIVVHCPTSFSRAHALASERV
jgi:hypothetical protein